MVCGQAAGAGTSSHKSQRHQGLLLEELKDFSVTVKHFESFPQPSSALAQSLGWAERGEGNVFCPSPSQSALPLDSKEFCHQPGMERWKSLSKVPCQTKTPLQSSSSNKIFI